jgi:hypothetical protein
MPARPRTAARVLALDDLKPGDRFAFARGIPFGARPLVYVKGPGRTFCRLDRLLTDAAWIAYEAPCPHLPVRRVTG